MNGGTAAKSIPLGTIRAKGLTPTLTDLKKLGTQLWCLFPAFGLPLKEENLFLFMLVRRKTRLIMVEHILGLN
jgi:hypothetical protein